MQLTRLRAAACALLAASVARPACAAGTGAGAPAPDAKWEFEGTGLAYVERSRVFVAEPVARITRLFAGGERVSAQVALDAMTGATPTGAQASGKVQTVTSASGSKTTRADQVPTAPFHDFRGALDLAYVQPVGSDLTVSTGGHVSREKDYVSSGGSALFALDVDRHLTTVSLGGSLEAARITPVGGMRLPLRDGVLDPVRTAGDKHVSSVMAGVSRVLTRSSMAAFNVTRTHEDGYLTEPYKIVSILNTDPNLGADTPVGAPVGSVSESRPSTRERRDVMLSTVVHLPQDVLYASYRYYWDDWGVRSSTVDLKLHAPLPRFGDVIPHLRGYTQTAADFFVFGFPGALPAGRRYATSDQRLGPLRSVTAGGTYMFRLPGRPGEFSVRAEYLRQWGKGNPDTAIGVQRTLDLFPAEDTVILTGGWTVRF